MRATVTQSLYVSEILIELVGKLLRNGWKNTESLMAIKIIKEVQLKSHLDQNLSAAVS